MDYRRILVEIFEAGLSAVRPDSALLSHLQWRDGKLFAGGREYDATKGKIYVVGAGKGAAPMARALEELLEDRLDDGAVIVKYDHSVPLDRLKIMEAAHPVPDEAGVRGAEELLRIAGVAHPEDLVICLFTGGASALLPAPAYGLTLADLKETTSRLLACGASIDELNAVRKHLSAISGGRLAQAAGGARILGIFVSDVIGDKLDVIASGPTAADSSTWQDCLEIIKKYKLQDILPEKVMAVIRAGVAGDIKETPKQGQLGNVNNIIIASNSQALAAAAVKARELGYEVETEAKPMCGEAREAASALMVKAKHISEERPGVRVCLLAGGETTVTLNGSGLGGRNQEMALAASIEIKHDESIHALFAGTDGTDGPTDAAGGFADSQVWQALGENAQDWLAENDSYHALQKAASLYVTGPTRTNVMDMAIVLIN